MASATSSGNCGGDEYPNALGLDWVRSDGWDTAYLAGITMTDHAKLGWIVLLTIIGLLLYMVAFGASLTPRPTDYTPIEYLSASCMGVVTDTTVFEFGVEGDIRWAEVYVQDVPGHQQLVGIASYAPGERGPLLLAEVLLPSGNILRYHSAEELRASPYADVCALTAVWMNRT